MRDIGLDVAPPAGECHDPKCPFHGRLPVRGQIFDCVVVSDKMEDTVVVMREFERKMPKFERFERGRPRFTLTTPHASMPRRATG